MADEYMKSPLPDWFDPDNPQHRATLLDSVEKNLGQGWVITDYDMAHHQVRLARKLSDTTTTDGDPAWFNKPTKALPLTDKQRQPSQGRRLAIKFETENPGFFLVRFEPWLGRAVLAPMDDKELRARQVIANVLGVDPWEILAGATTDGGFDIQVPKKYSSNTHLAKLNTAIQQDIGGPGWWVDIDPATLRGHITPGDPPTFPKIVPFDPAASTLECSVFGQRLRKPGENETPGSTQTLRLPSTDEPAAFMDWRAAHSLLLVGLGGTGKSVLTNVLAAVMLNQHVQISVVDNPTKASDYYWCRPWIQAGGWGCDSLIQYAGVLNNIVKEMNNGERAQAWRAHGWQNWYDIPQWAKQQFPIHCVIVDELSSMVSGAAMTRTLPKSALPPVWKTMLDSHAKYEINQAILRIAQVGRALGYRLILATQKAVKESGVPTTLRDIMGGRILLGDNPQPATWSNVFGNTEVPPVPKNVISEGVSKGTGSALIEGQGSFVFKTFWAVRDGLTDTQALGAWLINQIGLPDGVDETKYVESLRPVTEDTTVDVDFSSFLTSRIALGETDALNTSDVLPLLYAAWQDSLAEYGGETPDDEPPPAVKNPWPRDDLATITVDAARRDSGPRPLCPVCGEPIQPDGSCGCA